MNLKMKRLTVALAAAGIVGIATPAGAGSVFLTGHDDDYHFNFGATPGPTGAAGLAMAAALAMVRDGSALPVLTFDAGTELTNLMTGLGISFFNVNPSAAGLTAAGGAALFDHTKYSAFVVASVSTCGGCDNPVGTGLNIAAYESAIVDFFNAGGGILGLAGATDADAYAYVPQSATNAGGSPPRTGYVQTPFGALRGITAVNGDTTHNFFSEPGTGGLSSAYGVTERLFDPLTGTPESVALFRGTIACTPGTKDCGFVPEPGTLTLFGLALAGMGAIRRRFTRST